MDSDHPPVEVLRLAAKAAAVVALFAGAVRFLHVAPSVVFEPALLIWVLVGGAFLSATVVAILLPRFEELAGATLCTAAVLATVLGGGVRPMQILGWAHGYALLFLASGLFLLSAWGWSRREAASQPRPAAHEDAERVEG